LRQAADGAEYFLHRGRLAQDLGRLIDRSRRRRRDGRFRRRASYQRDCVIDVEGLGQILEGATLECRNGAVEVGVRRHDDDRNLRMPLLHLVQQREAGLARHSDVGDEHLRLADGERLQHFIRGGEGLEGNALARERLFEDPANRPVVVDDPHGPGFVAARRFVVIGIHL
jgi:hypothetical protein